MIEFFEIVDIVSAYFSLYTNWQKINNDDWYSLELAKSLKTVLKYVNQLASYITLHHEDIQIQLEYDIDSMQGKQFATVIKRTEEWRLLRKWAKTEQNFSSQSLTVQAICTCIKSSVKHFISQIK